MLVIGHKGCMEFTAPKCEGIKRSEGYMSAINPIIQHPLYIAVMYVLYYTYMCMKQYTVGVGF